MSSDDDRYYRIFGQGIRQRRTSLGMSQDELASGVGLSRTSVTNIERGRQRILLHQLQSFAQVLKIRPNELLPYEDAEISGQLLSENALAALPDNARSFARSLGLTGSIEKLDDE